MKTIKSKNRLTLSIKKVASAMSISLLVLLMASCNKDKNMSYLSVKMTDAPANYNAVMIDLQGVEVTGNSGGTVLLNTQTGLYNLLDFSNGADTMIATGSMEAGTMSQMRLILGPNSTVIVDGIEYPLSTPSAMQSGLKLQMHQMMEPGITYNVLLDFDANQSIVLQGNGTYQLKPVIRTIEMAMSGSIIGTITPVGIIATVAVTSNGITYTSVTNESGKFMIAGLPVGIYNITVTPPLPKLPVSITGKSVMMGVPTNLGTIAL
jgi:hypothetical protein